MPASASDLQPPFDPTGYASLSFAQLMQLVSGLAPYTDKGLVVTTEDVAGNPEVPDAATTTKWQRYLWRRITATTTNVYVWDENHANDATYLRWVSINVAGIGVGSIVNAMIADNTITDIKIASVDWSKILNAPVGLPPSGAAGGSLAGTYPNPSLAANAVVTASITDLNVTTGKIADEAVTNAKLNPSAVGLTLKRTNAGATAVEDAVVKISELANPGAGDALKIVRVNAAETAFEKVAMPGGAIQVVEGSTAAYDAIVAQIPFDDSLPQSGEGEEVTTVAITPTSATSVLYIDAVIHMSNENASTYMIIALFQDAIADALAAAWASSADNDQAFSIVLHYKVVAGSTTARTYKIRAGASSGNSNINGANGARVLGGALVSSIKVTEVVA